MQAHELRVAKGVDLWGDADAHESKSKGLVRLPFTQQAEPSLAAFVPDAVQKIRAEVSHVDRDGRPCG
jgi:hypothetical protein